MHILDNLLHFFSTKKNHDSNKTQGEMQICKKMQFRKKMQLFNWLFCVYPWLNLGTFVSKCNSPLNQKMTKNQQILVSKGWNFSKFPTKLKIHQEKKTENRKSTTKFTKIKKKLKKTQKSIFAPPHPARAPPKWPYFHYPLCFWNKEMGNALPTPLASSTTTHRYRNPFEDINWIFGGGHEFCFKKKNWTHPRPPSHPQSLMHTPHRWRHHTTPYKAHTRTNMHIPNMAPCGWAVPSPLWHAASFSSAAPHWTGERENAKSRDTLFCKIQDTHGHFVVQQFFGMSQVPLLGLQPIGSNPVGPPTLKTNLKTSWLYGGTQCTSTFEGFIRTFSCVW